MSLPTNPLSQDISEPLIRAAERELLLECIRRGECAAVIGSSNSGKSNLLRSLCLDASRHQLVDAQGMPPVMALVDCMKATNQESAFYELLLREVILALKAGGVHESIVFVLQARHDTLKAASSDVAIRSLFEECLEIVGKDSHRKVVLLLDELDEAYLCLPPWPFRILRSLSEELEQGSTGSDNGCPAWRHDLVGLLHGRSGCDLMRSRCVYVKEVTL